MLRENCRRPCHVLHSRHSREGAWQHRCSDSLSQPLASDSEIAGFRTAGHELVALLADYLEQLQHGPVFRPMTRAERAGLANMRLPDEPLEWGELLRVCRDELAAHPMGNGHPRFFAWVNSAPAPAGILGALAAAAINPSCAGGDHAATYLERATTRWLAELVGYPLDGGYGVLTSGGSMASIICLAAARQWAVRRAGLDVREHGMAAAQTAPLVLYSSVETHSCIRKAVELLGLGSRRHHSVPVDGDGRIDIAALREAIAGDHARGLTPFCLVGNAGTVGCGAVDPLRALGDVAEEEGLWLHVDGGCALVREADNLRDTFSLVPPYLRTEEGRGVGGPTWFSEYTIEQTRPYRALRLWMTLSRLGRAGLVANIG